MASSGRRKVESDESRDLISQLPEGVKEKILGRLGTRDVARTALLSTHWNDLWLRHGKLEFDSQFFELFRKRQRSKSTNVVNIINDILMLHAGPVKKFYLDIFYWHRAPKPRQSDVDRWCRYVSRNGVREFDIHLAGQYKLPSCILLCRTIKRMSLAGFTFDLPINARCIFPCVTSIIFDHVEFSDAVKGIVYSMPNLEEVFFAFCEGVDNFEIRAPKIEGFCHTGSIYEHGSRWLALHLNTIKGIGLCGGLLLCENVEEAALSFPTAINLEEIQLYGLSSGKQLTFAMQLLQKSPNLCKLDIRIDEPSSPDEMIAASRLLEDPNSCIINQDLKMLNRIDVQSFTGSTLQMLFVKMLLSKSPALERVELQNCEDIDPSKGVKILRELLGFPKASPKAEIFMKFLVS